MTDSPSSVQRKLQNWQLQLLDLSRANRLLYFKADRASSVPITRPAAADLFHQLVSQGKKLAFPAADEKELFTPAPLEAANSDPTQSDLQSDDTDPSPATLEAASPAPPDPPPSVEPGPPPPSKARIDEGAAPEPSASRKSDSTQLASSLSDQRLARALYNLRARARTALEEQGVNVLFVAFGLLHWIDPETQENVQSPLLLVPVTLNRDAGRQAYDLTMREDDLVLNPTLAHKLASSFALQLPTVPDDIEESGLTAYFDQVRLLIQQRSAAPAWQVSDEAILGVFSFQKLNLYQDLADYQDLFVAHPMIAALGGGPPLPPPPPLVTANELDDRVPPSDSFQVVDADSSQQEAIQAAKAGASFVLQGPPGTGKSQTITNIIAESLAVGKRVLFVSQKMAALEVVQRRLNEAGLGEFCLQLHSFKRDKREVVKELVDALDAPDVTLKPDYQAGLLELEAARTKLNAYARALHAPRFALHETVFHAHGELARLQGVPEVSFAVGDVVRVNANNLAQRTQVLERFAAMPDVIDRFQDHPWRGSAVRSVSFGLRDQLAQTLDELTHALPQYADHMQSLAAACQLRAPNNLVETQMLLDLLQECDPRLFALDVVAMQRRFVKEYTSMLRGVMPNYRADIRTLSEVRLSKDKLEYEQALDLIQRALAVEQTLSGPAAQADRVSDVPVFVRDTTVLAEQIKQALKTLAEVFGGNLPLVELARGGSLNLLSAGSGNPPRAVKFDQADFAALLPWLTRRRQSIDQLEPYAALLRLSDEANALGMNSFGKVALNAQLPAAQWRAAYLYGFWKAFVDAASQVDAALQSFDSRSHATLIERFRELDRQQMILARARIRALVRDRRPNNSWVDAASAEPTLLRREAAKKRRLKPLRKLFAEIPRLITDLKPCLLMSPISVSMLLDPAVFKFDLVVFDEASQIAPEEAAGAIMRGAQAIIVGDQQQLPPTRFFSVVGSEDEDAAAEAESARLFDSILEESTGLNLPQKMLLWHYRSRDEELIAFSNHHYYHDRLYTFPNVQYDGKAVGVEFMPVPEGVYRRGRNLRRNEAEARRVADLIFEHAAQSPDRTLGVIAFSYAQRDAIIAEWERRRRDQPQLEAFFDENAQEPFFIKNLEMVQGDERDMIIFSVGYGKDEAGKVSMNFGPLNQAGGERRLNVAVTRARYHVVLASSIMPEDIDLTRTASLGAQRLRDYMFFARDGIKTLGTMPAATAGAQSETSFEEAVYQALTQQGWTVHRQVGVSGYHIDLAVVDPKQPGRYLLGIECDGAMYHSAPTARDRDRLRRQILEQLGWRMQRIWSHDWIVNPAHEIEKIKARLNEASQPAPPAEEPLAVPVPAAASTASSTNSGSPADVAVEPGPQNAPPKTADGYLAAVQTPEAIANLPTYVWPYKRARLAPHSGEPLGQADPQRVASEVVRVVGAEGPVHLTLVFDRIASAWGVSRIGTKAKQVLLNAIRIAVQARQIEQRGEFLWPIGMAAPIVRAPDGADAPRPIDRIAPEEIVEAAYLCVQEARSLAEDDLVLQTAKLLGYTRRTAKIEAAIKPALEQLKASGRVEVDGAIIRARTE